MKKNGFTLVELLAVIAILAILVIIALPNVMGMFNQAKKNSFTTEVKEIFKMAQQQWISDSMLATKPITYSRVGGTATDNNTGNGLDMSGRTELDYAIEFNKAGEVVAYVATDNTYYFKFIMDSTTYTDVLKIEDIGTNENGKDYEVKTLTDEDKTGATVAVDSDGHATITLTAD